MAQYLRPRRGKKTTAIAEDIVLARGEFFLENPETGTGTGFGNIKIGDGETVYSQLPYFINGSTPGTAYAICSTDPAVKDKTAIVQNTATWELQTGTIVYVKFDYTNTYEATNASPVTLNVNNTGAKNIYADGTANPTGTNITFFGRANYVNCYLYNGSFWIWMGSSTDNNTEYSNATLGQCYGTCTTPTNTSTKSVVAADYSLTVGGFIAVKFTNAVGADASMNINNKGTRPIYYKATAITDGVILSGDTAYFLFDGTNYNLLGTDRGASVATTTMAGLMSAADKTKLNGIEEGHPSYNSTTGTPSADQSPSFGGTFTVNQISSDSTGHVSANTSRTITIPDATATTSSAGLMSAADKTKLNSISEGANEYVHPSYTARTSKPTADATPSFGGTFQVSQFSSDEYGHVSSMSDRTITIPNAVATTSSAGLMSAADKTKLDGLASNVYGVCGTAAGTAAKTVTPSNTNWALNIGAMAIIKFTYANTATSATLNINSTGAKAIYYEGAAIASGVIEAGDTCVFVYTGSNWLLIAIDTNTDGDFGSTD